MAAEHGNAGRARVLAEFTPQGMIAAYVALYERMLARNGASPAASLTARRS